MTGSNGAAAVAPAMEVFDPAPVAVAVFRGPDHVLSYTNASYRRLFGDRPLGVPAREALADLPPERLDVLDQVYERGEPVHLAPSMPLRLKDAHGEIRDRWFNVSMSLASPKDREATGEEPAGDQRTGEQRGVLVVAIDVTPQVTARKRIRALSEKRRRALQRYESLVTAGTEKVWVTDAGGMLIERSPGWERVTGMTWEELRGDGWLDSAHPEDRPSLAARWREALEDTPELFRHTYRLRIRDGSYRHVTLGAVPVREQGRVVEWVGACSDVEDQWQLERRRTLLNRASAAVTESPRADRAFGAMAQVIVPELADACGVYLFPDTAHLVDAERPVHINRVATVVRDGLPRPRGLRRTERVEPGSAFDRVLREECPVHTTPGDGGTTGLDMPPSVGAWAESAEVADVAMFPVLIAGRVEAIFVVYACADRKRLDAADLSLVQDLLDHSNGAFGHVLELRRSQRIAVELQRGLLSEPPQPEGLEILARYLPSSMADEVGGDWYDSFVLPDGSTSLIIGDVAGHDLRASVIMSKMRNKLRSLVVDREEPPGDILRRLDTVNQTLDPDEGTATCVYGKIEGTEGGPWQFNFSVAGHPPPLIVTRDGHARFLDGAQDIMLGALEPDMERASAVEPLPPGSTLLLYTDGLVERSDEDIDACLEQLRRHAAGIATEPLAIFCQELIDEPARASNDDIAVIAVRLPYGAGTTA